MSHAEILIAAQPAPPKTIRKLSKSRIAGYFFLTLWSLLGISLLAMIVTNWDVEKLQTYGPRLLHGLWITVKLVGMSFILGAILSIPLAFARMSKNKILSTLTYCYVYLFRGTPLLAQIFMVYYGFPSFRWLFEDIGLWWFFKDPFYCGVFAMTLNTAAYQTEIVRGAIQSVPSGQRRLQTPGHPYVDRPAQDHHPPGAYRRSTSLRQRDHPADQEFGHGVDHHRLRSDGRDALRFLAHL